jgi:hypothetical protein
MRFVMLAQPLFSLSSVSCMEEAESILPFALVPPLGISPDEGEAGIPVIGAAAGWCASFDEPGEAGDFD